LEPLGECADYLVRIIITFQHPKTIFCRREVRVLTLT